MQSTKPFITASLLALAAPAAAQFPPDSAIRALIAERVDAGRTAGIVVGLLEPDGSTRVFAYNEREHGEPEFDGATVFEIGSITKAFTGALLAEMVARGEVRLDDPVARYLPDGQRVPSRDGREITLLDLATHTSGLPRLPGNMRPSNPADPYADYSVEQLYQFLSDYELPRAVGAEFEYSNLGAGLLGHALARSAGRPYEALLRERILAPLGMTSTGVALTPEKAARLAPGHNALGAVVPSWNMGTLAAAGGLRSTVDDMLRFLAANLETDGELSRRIAKAHEPQRAAAGAMRVGLGWLILERPGGPIVAHDGATYGYSSMAVIDPVAGRAVIVLTNSIRASNDLALHLLDPNFALQPASGAAR